MSKEEYLNDSHVAGAGRAVQSLVLETLDLMGAAVDVVELGIYDVLLPGDQLKRITFHPEIGQERDDCELVTYGTPFLDTMIEVAKTGGRLQVRQIQSQSEPPANLDDKVANLVHFVKCKPPKVNRTWMEECFLLLCQFVVTFHADEVVEEQMTVLLDLQSLADITHLSSALSNHWFTVGTEVSDERFDLDNTRAPEATVAQGGLDFRASHSGIPVYPTSTPFRLKDSLVWGVQALKPQIEKAIVHIQSENHLQREDELAKSRHYYETTLNKLAKQLFGTTDTEKQERLKKKIEVTTLDRDRRMEDITRAYDVTTDVHLDQAILYRVPIACVEAQLQQRVDVFYYVFRYHTWASAWGPVTCPNCHQPATRLERGITSWHCGCEGTRAFEA